MSAKIALIAAVATNGVIGVGDGLPWRLPSDFAFFKRTTMGKPLIMGRKTFDSIGRPLPGRTNIVVSRQEGYQPDGVLIFGDLKEAIEHAQAIAEVDNVPEVMIGGGGEIYSQAMPLVDRLYLTHVDASPEGEAYFPMIDLSVWKVVGEPPIAPSSKDSATYRIKVYERQ